MHPILQQIQMYLTQAGNNEVDMPEEIIEEFGNRCKELMKAAFSTEQNNDFTIRMSSVGRPLCQLQMEKSGAEKEASAYSLTMKMLIGDMIEAAAIAIMKGAGVPIQEVHTPMELDIGGIKIKGTLDAVISDKVYDIKSASPYAFTSKFNAPDGFQRIREDDPFGYMSQGYLYAQSANRRFGGWIAINKSTGEWAICEAPIADNAYRKEALKRAEDNITKLVSDAPFERCFTPTMEIFNKRATGNQTLDVTCSYCPYKGPCWGKVTYAAQPCSKAQFPKKFWYVGEVKS